MEKDRKSSRANRKQRADSVTAAVAVAQAAFAPIKPPKHVPLQKKELPFFESIVDEFTRSEWTNHQLEIASLLARAMCDMEEQQRKLLREGPLVEMFAPNGKKYKTINPRKTVVQQCASTILSMRRSLSLHARARAGEARDVKKRRDIEKQIEDGVRDFHDPDGLIARPIH